MYDAESIRVLYVGVVDFDLAIITLCSFGAENIRALIVLWNVIVNSLYSNCEVSVCNIPKFMACDFMKVSLKTIEVLQL